MLKTAEPSGLIWQRQSTKVRTWLCFHFAPSTSCSLFLAASTSRLFWHTLSPGMYWDLWKCEWLEALSPSSWFAYSDANIVGMCFSLCLRSPQALSGLSLVIMTTIFPFHLMLWLLLWLSPYTGDGHHMSLICEIILPGIFWNFSQKMVLL